MNQQFRDSLDAYYRDAQSWGRDREDALRSSRRIAWIVAAIALAVAILLAVALVVLLPLKTVQTHTLLVDRHTQDGPWVSVGIEPLAPDADATMFKQEANLTGAAAAARKAVEWRDWMQRFTGSSAK